MENSEKTRDDLLQELSDIKEQLSSLKDKSCSFLIDGLNTEECIDFFQSIIAAITEPILILNAQLECVFANKSFTEMFGIESSKIKGVSVYEIGNGLLDLKDLRNLLEELLAIHMDFDGYEVNLNLLNIGERIMSLSATDVHQKSDDERLLLLNFIDNTEQKKAEKKQREDEEKYKSLFETSKDAVMILEPPDWSFTAGNPATIDMFRCDSEADFTSKQPWVVSPEYQPDGQLSVIKAKEMIDRAVKDGSNYFEWVHKRLDTEEFSATVLLSRIDLKRKTLLQATVRDITERKQVEEELRIHRFHLEEIVKARTAELLESEGKYRTLVEQSHDGIYIYGTNRFLFVNDRMCNLMQYSRDELLAVKFSDLIYADDRKMINDDGTIREGFSEVPNVFQLRLIRKDSEIRYIEFSIRKLTYSGEEAILGIARDITTMKQLEEEQRKIEKLESLGLLAGGIAHDFNNFLTAIIGNISLARTMVEPGSDLYEILTSSEHAASKASNLPRQLLTFSRGGDPVKTRISISRLLKESTAFVLSGSISTAEYSIENNLKQVIADKEQIGQVFNNIVINAYQAMPEGGQVHVSAKNITIDENNPAAIPEGQYVMITIKDDGYGIEEDHLSRVFDPFFTTKQNGTGLGLATAYSIIRKHHGHIKVETEVGKGTAFTIYLSVDSSSEDLETHESGPAKLSGGKILVMDDQEMVRKTATSMLKKLGYQVDSAINGSETIEKYTRGMDTMEPYNAVILDLTIPGGMGGIDTMQELLKIDPDVTAIVSSGYSTAPVMADYTSYGFSGVMIKPYSISQISDLMRNIFNE
ncbi:MAG: PAS domain S-box protein [Candidatus Aegiribacteria sp.]|nr:PAS domain S-box protein [Candidatus Aegiribacteria sp.]